MECLKTMWELPAYMSLQGGATPTTKAGDATHLRDWTAPHLIVDGATLGCRN
jgi:hypothetical protein